MKLPSSQDVKIKVKRLSKGARTYIRRMKQAKRRESIFVVPKKKK